MLKKPSSQQKVWGSDPSFKINREHDFNDEFKHLSHFEFIKIIANNFLTVKLINKIHYHFNIL